MYISGISQENKGQVRVWRSSGQDQCHMSKNGPRSLLNPPYSRKPLATRRLHGSMILQNRSYWRNRHFCHMTGSDHA